MRFVLLALILIWSGFATAQQITIPPSPVGTAAPGQIPGTGTNDTPCVGCVGEVIEAVAASGSISMSNGTTAGITSITLTPGDWEVSGVCAFTPAATTSATQYFCSQNTAGATTPNTNPGFFTQINFGAVVTGGFQFSTLAGSPQTYRVSTNTTVFLNGLANFTVSTMTAGGKIHARRMR